MNFDVSVVVPLYNKAKEVEHALRSVLMQSRLPVEIIVVDDGSTDQSASIVESIGSDAIRLIRTENRGVSAARNTAINEARGRWVALLDADDYWEPTYLEEVERMVKRYPTCGAYATAFRVDDGKGLKSVSQPTTDGIVDFFGESLRSRYVLIPSATTLNRKAVLHAGGFPEGMRIGEDQFLWTKIARENEVCFSTKKLVVYSKVAENKSAAIYRPERSIQSLKHLYDPDASAQSNEYVAKVALGKALMLSVKGDTAYARQTLRFFAYTKRNRWLLWRLRVVNSLPKAWRVAAVGFYDWMAWLLVRRGV